MILMQHLFPLLRYMPQPVESNKSEFLNIANVDKYSESYEI